MAASPTPPYRRRRSLALAGLLAVLVAVVLVVAGALGSGGGGAGGATKAAAHGAGDGGKGGAARTTATAATGPARDLGAPGPPRPVPILMYHVVSDPFPNSPYPDLYVPRAQFADQMRALKRAGYTAVTLQEAWDSWHANGPLPRRAVVVSFDDGYRSHITNAMPVLRVLGWPGVLNLELNNIRSDYGLTAPQVRQLIAVGWEVDSHTITHPDLTTVDAARLQHEIADSRAELKRRFGIPVNFFCYPAGRYDAAAIAAVQRAGYLAATTTEPGLAQPAQADRFTLHRVRVNNGISGAGLVAQLASLGAAG
ncbi:MAG TPA: polysaccharide deacetylase family protein [Conexibacter sp.]|jgi:peptidoglycan/xylan/chitin deacetylase (PgdA/CDA1 family)|nr:polysaccharide deacetylase family protein [Conexibacter sp.]